MPSRLADHLSAARQRRFVGRYEERAIFQSALQAGELPFFVLRIFGPGGVGKTTLLSEFGRLCEEVQVKAFYLDGRSVEPSPESFGHNLSLAMGLASTNSPLEFLAVQPGRCVLLIDTYETLAPLDGWLRQVFLPQLPETVLTVLAGRDPPSLAWRADPGWQTLVRTLPLRNLSPDESRAFLANRAIPSEQHSSILGFTQGHPLALALVADLFAQRQDMLGDFQPQAAPDLIKTLLEHLVQKVPSPAHRTALEACAIVRVITEALLAEMLGMPYPSGGSPVAPQQAPAGHSAQELFQWLHELSFIEVRRGGLFPHDLVRDALAADLHWRNPDWYAELHRRARVYYTNRLGKTAGHSQQRILLDLVYLHRDNPVVRPFFEWQASGGALTDSMRAEDVAALVAMVGRHEGEDSARLASYWFQRQPDGVLVYRDSAGQPAAFLAMVALHEASSEDLATDPAAQAAWRYVQRSAALRPGEGATLFRFWMADNTYQAVSALQSLIFISMVRHYLTTPGLAFTFLPCAQPEFWAPVFAYADLARIPEADFQVEKRHYGVYGHDWRARPPAAWLALLAERETTAEPASAPPSGSGALVVLSQPNFTQAVRDAVRYFRDADRLRQNPLLRSRLVVERAGNQAGLAERMATLQALIQETIHSLERSPRQVRYYRALYHTYFQPAATQEQAAEVLDLPFSTYRRHLRTGMKLVGELLWQQEIGGLENEPKLNQK